MAQSDTADRILHAATVLFAERGFIETSLRTITGMADVNLAAVNYHFGSKKALITAVFERFLTPFVAQLSERLDVIERRATVEATPSSDLLLRAAFESLLDAVNSVDGDLQRFMRLLNLAYSQAQAHLRHSLMQKYGSTYRRFLKSLHQALPHVSPKAFYWRLYFMLGAAVFTLSSFHSIRTLLLDEYGADTQVDDAVDLMVPALTGMLQTPDEQS